MEKMLRKTEACGIMEVNGLMTWDREVEKILAQRIRSLHQEIPKGYT